MIQIGPLRNGNNAVTQPFDEPPHIQIGPLRNGNVIGRVIRYGVDSNRTVAEWKYWAVSPRWIRAFKSDRCGMEIRTAALMSERQYSNRTVAEWKLVRPSNSNRTVIQIGPLRNGNFYCFNFVFWHEFKSDRCGMEID